MGAGSVFLNTDYDAYILADINSDLINLYNIVKLRTDDFVRDARTLFADEFNNSDQFTCCEKSSILAPSLTAGRCCSCT